jgi:hypothetical protein
VAAGLALVTVIQRDSRWIVLVPGVTIAGVGLRLSVDTSARGAIRVIVPFLRSRFRKTMTQSLRTIAALLECRRP